MLQRIAHYEIVERIAAGGQATVYLARDRDRGLGRVAAIKLLHPHVSQDAISVERFLREGRTAAALSHPNVATIYEVGGGKRQLFYRDGILAGVAP